MGGWSEQERNAGYAEQTRLQHAVDLEIGMMFDPDKEEGASFPGRQDDGAPCWSLENVFGGNLEEPRIWGVILHKSCSLDVGCATSNTCAVRISERRVVENIEGI